MGRVQVNLKLDEKIVKEMEKLVEEGHFKTKTEAFKEAVQLLLKSRRAADLARRIDEIREGTEMAPSVTKAVVKAHEEEDEL
jgi:Arc/MetJ-type ribon-helix-helix transcriptional regulator